MKPTLITLAFISAISHISCAEVDVNRKMIRMPITRIHHKKQSLRKRGTFTSSLLNASGKEYLVEVGVGTPPQMFNVTLDTGSADFWIPSDACPAAMCPLTRFNEKASSTYKTITPASKLSIVYGIGFAKGTYSLDSVTLGGASLPNRTVGLVSNTSDILGLPSDIDTIDPSNGIFGLGYPGLSMSEDGKSKQQNHFVVQLAQSQLISDPIFSVFLNPNFAIGSVGEVLLGGIDTNKISGDVQYAPVVPYNLSSYYVIPNMNQQANAPNSTYLYWTIPGQSVSTSTGYVHNSTQLQPYILDTGTTLTYVPANVAKDIVMSVTKNASTTTLDSINGIYMVSCDLAKNTQDYVDFKISTSLSAVSSQPITAHVKVSDLVIPLDAGALTASQSKNCMFGIAPASLDLDLTSGETWIIGESVIRSIYTVFDLKQNRVGIAKLSANAANTTTSVSSSSSSSSSGSNKSGNANGGNPTSSKDQSTSTSGGTRVMARVVLSLFLVSSVIYII